MCMTELQVFKLANRGHCIDVNFTASVLGNTARLSSVHYVHIPTKVLSLKQVHGSVSHTLSTLCDYDTRMSVQPTSAIVSQMIPYLGVFH